MVSKKPHRSRKHLGYRPPASYVWSFYGLLGAWTVACIWLLGARALRLGWPLGQWFMVAFVVAYTWYFSLGVSYEAELDAEETLLLRSFRRTLRVPVREITLVEGPRLAVISYCFIRFRLEREKAYLFCRITDPDLVGLLYRLASLNRDLRLKGIPPRPQGAG